MKNIFNNEDSYFEHIIYTVDFSEYKQTEFPKNLMAKPYKCYLEHLIESNKPVNKECLIVNDNMVPAWVNADNLHDYMYFGIHPFCKALNIDTQDKIKKWLLP